MVSYPSAIITWVDRVDNVDYNYAGDINSAIAEVQGIAKDLVGVGGTAGGLAQGGASFYARWTAQHNTSGSHKSLTTDTLNASGLITASGGIQGNVTGAVTGNATTSSSCTGNAASATILATARAINGVDFNGSAPITVTADSNTLSGTTLKSSVVNSSLTSVGTLTNLAVTNKITGSINGNCDGSSATVTGAAQTAITSVGTLTSLAVTNGVTAGSVSSGASSTALMWKVLDIGTWDMDSTITVSVAHGLGASYTKIVSVNAMIFPDASGVIIPLDYVYYSTGVAAGSIGGIGDTNLTLYRTNQGTFDSSSYSGSANRGKVFIAYTA
jgi:hypothetical protein